MFRGNYSCIITLLICTSLFNTVPWKITLCEGGNPSSPEIAVTFLQVPSPLSNLNNAEFRYKVSGGGGEETGIPCSICCASCMLDGKIPDQCGENITSFHGLQDGDHTFEVCAKQSQGGMSCATYNWTIDTAAPKAIIRTSTSFTSDYNITAYISFSEPCSLGGGFQCSSVNTCDLLVYGAGQVIPQTLTTLVPNQKYSMLISLSSKVEYGNVTLAMNKSSCTDAAGNKFMRVENPRSVIAHFDRRSVSVSMKVNVPEKQIDINGQPETVQATNDNNNLKVYLNFSLPVSNLSGSILKFLNVSNAGLQPLPDESDGNTRFGFRIVNVSTSEVVTVQLNSSNIAGTPVSPVAPAAFVVDSTRPVVSLSTSTDIVIRETSIQANIESTKPVFGLNFTHINILGGHLKSFEEGNNNMHYVLNIQTLDENNVIHINIPENVTSDAAGNGNLPSNILSVRHYHTISALPAAAAACVTGSFLATSLVAGLLTVSTSTLQSAGVIAGSSRASSNLFRTASYIQVFALSRMVGVTPPAEYYEFTANLKWSIPYLNLPWEKRHDDNNNNGVSSSVSTKLTGLVKGVSRQTRDPVNAATPSLPIPQLGSLIQRPNQKPTATGYVPSPQESNGWLDFERCMFWIALIGGGLTLLHSLLVLLLKLKRGYDQRKRLGALEFPRFQIFLLIFATPSICKASGSIIRGGTGVGKAIGSLLLAMILLLQLSQFVFLTIGITRAKLLQYKEDRRVNQKFLWYQRVIRATLGSGEKGQWKWNQEQHNTNSMPEVDNTDQSDNVNLIRYGPLFETLRGPPNYMFSSRISRGNNNNTQKLREGAIVSGDETEPPFIQKLFGSLRIYYLQIESLKQFILGVMAGLYSHGARSRTPAIILLCVTSFQLCFIVLKKPFIKRRVQLVEIISIASQVGNFLAMVILKDHGYSPSGEKKVSIAMIVLFLFGFLPLMTNGWFGLRKQVRQSGGLKMVTRGIVMLVFSDSALLEDGDDGANEEENGNTTKDTDEKERRSTESGYPSRTKRGPTRRQPVKNNAGMKVDKGRTTTVENNGADVETKEDDNDIMTLDDEETHMGSGLVEESTAMNSVVEGGDNGVTDEQGEDENDVMPLDDKETHMGSDLVESTTMNSVVEGGDNGVMDEQREDENDLMPPDGEESHMGSDLVDESTTMNSVVEGEDNGVMDEQREDENDIMPLDGEERKTNSNLVEESTMDNVTGGEDNVVKEELRKDDNYTMPLDEGDRKTSSETRHPRKIGMDLLKEEVPMGNVVGDEYDGAEEDLRDNVNSPSSGRERQTGSKSKHSSKIDQGPTRQSRKMAGSDLDEQITACDVIDDGVEEELRDDDNDTMLLSGNEIQTGFGSKHSSRTSPGSSKQPRKMVGSTLVEDINRNYVVEEEGDGEEEKLRENENDFVPHNEIESHIDSQRRHTFKLGGGLTRQPKKMRRSNLVKEITGDQDDSVVEEPKEEDDETMPYDGRERYIDSKTRHTSKTGQTLTRKPRNMGDFGLVAEIVRDEDEGVDKELRKYDNETDRA